MNRSHCRRGATNLLYWLGAGSLVVLAVLCWLLAYGMQRGPAQAPKDVTMFCAAALRLPVDQIAAQYEQRYGVCVRLQYGGSQTLLSQIEVGKNGDLYLAGDNGYLRLGRGKGLVAEQIPLLVMRPVLVVRQGNPRNIRGIADLLRGDVRVALANPDQAAVGRETRRLLRAAGQWEAIERQVTRHGVFKPTEPDVANDAKLGSVDAAILWDATAARYPELEVLAVPELERGAAHVAVGVLTCSQDPASALRFARYLAAGDRGLETFRAMGFKTVEGDAWAESPQLTFFAGAVNRRALEPIVDEFARREGLVVNTVYNGCGILTAQMRSLRAGRQSGFPDVYMACDVYYLDVVREMFQDVVHVSHADIVIAVKKGNPKRVRALADLARPGVRVALGQPDQCTIGVLSRRLLQAENLYDRVLKDNVVTQTATSAMLVPQVTTGSADAVLAYVTDTLAERARLEVIRVDSPLARAVQPFSIAKTSERKQLARRLLEAIARSRSRFESAGFEWEMEE